MKEAVVALITAGIPAIITLITLLIEKEKKIKKLEVLNKSEIRFNALFFSSEFLNTVHERVADIFEKTKAERFLILYAINGKDDFNTVTVCYEMSNKHDIVGATRRYKKLSIDGAYKNMLKRCEYEKTLILDVAKMEDCLLKSIYLSPEEQVYHSIIKFIARLKIDENQHVLMYMSIATKNIEEFTKNELNLIKYNSDQIRIEANNVIVN